MDDVRATFQLAARLDVRLFISAYAARHPLPGASGYRMGRRKVNVWSMAVAIIASIISVVMMCIASVRPEHQARVSIFVCGPIMISHQRHPNHPHHHQDKSNERSQASVRQNQEPAGQLPFPYPAVSVEWQAVSPSITLLLVSSSWQTSQTLIRGHVPVPVPVRLFLTARRAV
jgi:hypothetical protein